jgi:acyl-coenzyme A thioesterase PaaI-like protein
VIRGVRLGDNGCVDKIRESSGRQGLMTTLGARLLDVEKGRVRIEVPYAQTLTQQHGYFHAAVVTAAADTAQTNMRIGAR